MPVLGIGMLAPEPHRTTRQPAVNRSTEPAICASSDPSAYVPIWRGQMQAPVVLSYSRYERFHRREPLTPRA